MSYYSKALLKSTKSNFILVENLEKVTDDRIIKYLKTRILVQKWIEEVLEITIKEELEISLKNGIILCTLLNTIYNNIVPKIFTKFDFGFKNNIEFFIMGLNEIGFPIHKQFTIKDLYDGENFVLVIECLSELSKFVCTKIGFHIPMKPLSTISDSNIKIPSEDEKVLLKIKLSQIFEKGKKSSTNSSNSKTLSTNSSNSSTTSTLTSPTITVSSTTSSTQQQKIKPPVPVRKSLVPDVNDIIVDSQQQNDQQEISLKNIKFNEKNIQGFTKFQALYRGYKCRQFVKKLKRDIAYREKVQNEILKTEEDYIKKLNLLINYYMIPLYEKEYITKDQQKLIFSNIEIIYNFGQTLLEQLRERCGSKWTPYQKLSDIFLQISVFLKVYSSYVQNYDSSIECVKELKKNEKFQRILEEISEQPEIQNYDIDSFLILPVQRIPRYFLLLSDLVKHTWSDHPDQKQLTEAAEKIKNIANFLNEKKRQAENIAIFSEIQRNLIGKGIPELFIPTRQYIKTINYQIPDTKSDIVIYIFNDIIIHGKPIAKSFFTSSNEKKQIQFKGLLELEKIEIKDDDLKLNYLNLYEYNNSNNNNNNIDNNNNISLTSSTGSTGSNSNGNSSNNNNSNNNMELKLQIILKNENEKNLIKSELNKLISQFKDISKNNTLKKQSLNKNAGSPILNNSLSNYSPIDSPRLDLLNDNIKSQQSQQSQQQPQGSESPVKPRLQRKNAIHDNLLLNSNNNELINDPILLVVDEKQQQPITKPRSRSTIKIIKNHLTIKRNKKKDKHLSLDEASIDQITGGDNSSNCSDLDDSCPNSKKLNGSDSTNSSPLSLSVPTTPPLNSSISISSSSSSSSSKSTTNELNLLNESQNILSYSQILESRKSLDQDKLESYLSEDEFKNLFEIDKENFYKLPKWKQSQKKVNLKLY